MKRKYFTPCIAKKITRKMSFIYFSIYFLILSALLAAIVPQLDRAADERAKNTLLMMCNDLEHAQKSLDSYSNSLYYSDALTMSLSAYAQDKTAKNQADIEQALSNCVAENHLLLAASMEDCGHHYFSSYFFRNIVNQKNISEDARYQKLFSSLRGSYFSFLPRSKFHTLPLNEQGTTYFYDVLVLTKVMVFNQQPYVVRFYYDISSVIDDMKLQSKNTFTDYAFLESETILYTDINTLSSDESPCRWNDIFAYDKTTGQKTLSSGIFYYQKILSSDWILTAYATNTLFYHSAYIIIGIIAALYIISPVLYSFFLKPTVTKLLSPLGQLHNAMKNYTVGDSIYLQINTKDEIQDLSMIYNQMIEKINAQIKSIQQQEHINSVINYKLLATQIDPHFIYNTMNIINIMARQENNTAVIEINTALTRILQERLNTKLSIYDTLENELETLRHYKLIMDYRYNNKIYLQIDVDDSLLQCSIPKNIFQPLVENSYYHGFAALKPEQEGHIALLAYSLDNRLEIELSDDGACISPERIALLRNDSYQIYNDKKPHIGLDNIRQRLKYMYPDNYQFEIHSTPGYGTTIAISLPLAQIPQAEKEIQV